MPGADPSIYGNVQTPQINIPSPLDMAQKSMQLSQMGMQQMQMARQLRMQSAMQDAYMRNTDPNTGQLDQGGVLSSLGKSGDVMAQQQAAITFAQQNEATAKAKASQLDAAQKTLSITLPYYKYLNTIPEDERPAVWPQLIQSMKDQNVDTSRMDPTYDPVTFQQHLQTGLDSQQGLESMLAQANIGKTQAEAAKDLAEAANNPLKIGAEELGKFNEDVNNASSRKETGALMQTRDRADRLVALANSGAPQNETTQARIARLNQTIPGLANEYSVGLASILQGGVPSDSLMKETGLDTAGSNIASLKQKWDAQPTAGNQGALINAYVDAAQKMRDFSTDRLQQVADRARQSYPYANKYFGPQMDKIAAPLTTPGVSGSALAGSPQGSDAANATSYRKVGSFVSADEVAQYATVHGKTLKQAQTILKDKGYVLGQ